jgi:hypothetical protein
MEHSSCQSGGRARSSTISGHDEIRAFAGHFAAQRAAGTLFRHMVSNIAETITGNRAAASAYLLVLISKDGSHRAFHPAATRAS